MATDLDILRHKEWLGLLQPVGLVVSPPALIKAQAVIDRGKLVDLQERLQAVVSTAPIARHKGESIAWIENVSAFTQQVLGWRDRDLVGAPGQEALPEQLAVALTSYGETLRPTYAVRDPDSEQWVLLIRKIAPGLSFDEDDPTTATGQGWQASVQAKFERLLRETGVSAGLLVNGTEIRLVYAPKGESSGHLTFPVQAMTEVPGRLILGALDLLLGEDRLFNVPENQRLSRLLEDSRSYQAEVSTKLSGQVLDALWELLRGFQSADAAASGKILTPLLVSLSRSGRGTEGEGLKAEGEGLKAEGEGLKAEGEGGQHIYGGLIATLMRLVFLLYAEDEGLMPDDEVYQSNYAVSGLYEKLREDAGSYPDTMDQRYGAWAALLSLFRLVYDGGGATEEYLPARHGQLFDPDAYPYLEGRSIGSEFATYGRLEAPRIADGVVYRMLDKLLLLDGERLSYRALDVEQIGSVYEAIMGYEVEVAEGLSIAVKPKDVVVDVEALLAEKPGNRAKELQALAECKLTGKGATDIKEAKTSEDILAALGSRVSSRTQTPLRSGSLYLQPGEERRRSGSHYTPRKLTQPIVEKTLEPVLKQLGEHPTPEQLLDLKVCDLAMGSAAFLVEACRQLADKLVEAWNYYGKPADLPETVEDVVVARRLVAQRCLYGVDKNPFAVNLARLSLWLVTLAKDLPFTFLDHALKCGDSLVGLTKAEIGSFGASAAYEPTFFEDHKQLMKQSQAKALVYRQAIQTTDTLTDGDAEEKQALLQTLDRTLAPARLTANVAIASFFAGANAKQRQQKREEFGGKLIGYEKNLVSEAEIQAIAAQLTAAEKAVLPFNWELEFPEVFERENPGFDAIVGNPPFMGGKKISGSYSKSYLNFIQSLTPEAGGQADLVAYFFRRSFSLIRTMGVFGLVATNTISQGDTRASSLRWICLNGGTLFNADKNYKWVGDAAVMVSIVHGIRGKYKGRAFINGKNVEKITAYLFNKGSSDNPHRFTRNSEYISKGVEVGCPSFIFDDADSEALPLSLKEELITEDFDNRDRIVPFIGGDEILNDPNHSPTRYVINLHGLQEKVALKWSRLMQILQEKVVPHREKTGDSHISYWCYRRPGILAKNFEGKQYIVRPSPSKFHVFAFIPKSVIVATPHAVIFSENNSFFSILQSRIHEIWALFFASSLGATPRYPPSDCFETFPFPMDWETNSSLEAVGKNYYEFRADLMVRHNEGLTATYNRFHDPDETNPDILKLRELHAECDRAVLDAYGWHDIPTTCEFLLDYEDEDPEGTSKRKKPWRYRWPEEVHDEVLARLLKLNQERATAEIQGRTKRRKEPAKTPTADQTATATHTPKQLDLIPPDTEQLDLL